MDTRLETSHPQQQTAAEALVNALVPQAAACRHLSTEPDAAETAMTMSTMTSMTVATPESRQGTETAVARAHVTMMVDTAVTVAAHRSVPSRGAAATGGFPLATRIITTGTTDDRQTTDKVVRRLRHYPLPVLAKAASGESGPTGHPTARTCDGAARRQRGVPRNLWSLSPIRLNRSPSLCTATDTVVVHMWPSNEPLAELMKLATEGLPDGCPSPVDVRRAAAGASQKPLCFIEFRTVDDAADFLQAHRVNEPCGYGLVRDEKVYPLQYSMRNSVSSPFLRSTTPKRRRNRSRSPPARGRSPPIRKPTNTIVVDGWPNDKGLIELEELATQGLPASCHPPLDVRREAGDSIALQRLCFIQFRTVDDATKFLRAHRVNEPCAYGLVCGDKVYGLQYSRRNSNPDPFPGNILNRSRSTTPKRRRLRSPSPSPPRSPPARGSSPPIRQPTNTIVMETWPYEKSLAELEKLLTEGLPESGPSPLDVRRVSHICFIQFKTVEDAIECLQAHRVKEPCLYGLVSGGEVYPMQYSRRNSVTVTPRKPRPVLIPKNPPTIPRNPLDRLSLADWMK